MFISNFICMYVYVFACLTLLVCVCVSSFPSQFDLHTNCNQFICLLFTSPSLPSSISLFLSFSLLTFLIFAIIIRIFVQPLKQFLPNIPNTFRTHTQQICLSTDYTVHNFYAQLLLLLFLLLFINIQYFFWYLLYLSAYLLVQFSRLQLG